MSEGKNTDSDLPEPLLTYEEFLKAKYRIKSEHQNRYVFSIYFLGMAFGISLFYFIWGKEATGGREFFYRGGTLLLLIIGILIEFFAIPKITRPWRMQYEEYLAHPEKYDF